MNNIQIFQNDQFGQVRVSKSETGEPMFAAIDIARSLGYARPADAVADHCKGVAVLPTPTEGGVQQMKFIAESDVFRLIMRSRLPQAEQFQDWVCEDILPSIRKTGGYIPTQVEDTPEVIMAKALRIAQATIESQKQKVQRLEERNAEMRPKEIFADAVVTSDRSCLVGELAKILNQNGVNIGQNRLFEWMRQHNYLCSKGEYYNQPTQRAMDLGLFEMKKTAITKPDGTVLTSTTTKVSGKGQVYFVNKFLNRKTA